MWFFQLTDVEPQCFNWEYCNSTSSLDIMHDLEAHAFLLSLSLSPNRERRQQRAAWIVSAMSNMSKRKECGLILQKAIGC